MSGGQVSRSGAVVTLRPLGTSLPLAFLALGLASATFAAVELHWVPASQARVAGLVAVLLTAPLQGLASVLGFLSRDPVAGTGAGVLAGTWAVVGVTTLTSPPGSTSDALGVLLVAAALAVTVPVSSGWSKPVAALVMGLSGLRFAVTGLYQLIGSPGWQTAAGASGLLLALAALYGALAFELEGVHGRAVLPIGRQSPPDGPTLRDEPGVRDHL